MVKNRTRLIARGKSKNGFNFHHKLTLTFNDLESKSFHFLNNEKKVILFANIENAVWQLLIVSNYMCFNNTNYKKVMPGTALVLQLNLINNLLKVQLQIFRCK